MCAIFQLSELNLSSKEDELGYWRFSPVLCAQLHHHSVTHFRNNPMGTWIKETSKAIYLMEGGYWISRLSKYPSKTNPDEQVLNIQAIRSWFMREDYPRAMTVSWKATEEPNPKPAPPAPPPPPPILELARSATTGCSLLSTLRGESCGRIKTPLGSGPLVMVTLQPRDHLRFLPARRLLSSKQKRSSKRIWHYLKKAFVISLRWRSTATNLRRWCPLALTWA